MARTVYSEEIRSRAVLLGMEYGPAEAGRRVQVPAGTVASWMSRAGVASVATENVKAATAHRVANAEERRSRLADRMLELAELATDQCKELVADASLRDVVGLFTRAVHDHQLLSGNATQRTEHQGIEAAHAALDEVAERRTA